MSWPLSQDYNEAIQDPVNSFGDAELKTGEAVTNALGIPMPRSGNFADVYEVRCPSGSRWAVKCFTREIHGLRDRYNEISKYLHQANLPFMVDFQYLEQGIRVRGQWYPILKMQWVEGFVLNEFVRDNLDKKPILQALGQIWLRMARRLREAKLAHCDLQHGNVMFVPGSTANSLAVKLIDYDGMCVPALAGKKSGEVGHPAYQHPERLRTGAYNQEVDRFSLLSISTALRCLTVGGRSLWDRYDNGDNLLFRQADLQEPKSSPLFQELLSIGDPQTKQMVKELYRACQAPLAKVPLVTDLLPEEKPVTKVTTTVAARPIAAAQEPAWDFNEQEQEASAPIVKKRRTARKMPGWAWGAIAGVAALLLVGVGVGVGLGLRKGPAKKEPAPVALNKPEATVSEPEAPNPGEAPKSPDSKAAGAEASSPETGNTQTTEATQPTPAPVEAPAEDVAQSKRILLLSPSGDSLAVANEGDKTWRLVNPRTGTLIREFSGGEGTVTAVAFSADGRRALSNGDDGMLRLWDLQTGQMIGTRKAYNQPVVSIALSPDGTKAAYANGGVDTEVWNFEKNTGAGHHNNHKVVSVAFSADGRYLVCGYEKGDKPEDPQLFLWPLVQGINPKVFRGSAKAVNSIACSPDGKYLATGQQGEPSEMVLWDMATSKLQRYIRFPNRSVVQQVLFSPNSQMILGACGNFISVWRIREGSYVGGFNNPNRLLVGAFTPDGKEALCASYVDGKTNFRSIRLPESNLAASPPPPTFATKGIVWNPPVDPDGDCKFTVSSGKLTLTLPDQKFHDLAVENNRINAPRLLGDVEGDFTVQVHVAGDFSTQSIQAAGLHLRVDDKTYLRLERGCIGASAGSFWELRQDGRKVRTSTITNISKPEGYVRLERRGGQLFGWHSDDGATWTDLKPLFEVSLPSKVKIGVAAISISKSFAPSFDQFQLKRGQGEMVHVDWPPRDFLSTVVVQPPTPAPSASVVQPPMPMPSRLGDRRQLAPEASAVDAAVKDIRASHQNDPRDKLLNALWQETNTARNDPVRHYALLRVIRDVTAESNVRAALSAAQQMAQAFKVNLLDMKCAALETAAKSGTQPATDILELGLPLLDEAVGEENYAVLSRLVKVLRLSAGKAADPSLRVSVEPSLKRAEAVRLEYDKLQPERKTLLDKPDDAKANLAVGLFHCVTRGDWLEGLPFLARGGDAALQTLAEKDLASPDDPDMQKALGDDWFRRAEGVNTKARKTAYQRRAHYWYQHAATQLKGMKRSEVEGRIRTLAKAIPELQRLLPNLGIYHRGATADAKTGAVRFRPPYGAATRTCYTGPLDITVLARSMKTDLNISIGNGGRLMAGYDVFKKIDRLYVFRPDGLPDSLGSRAVEKPITLPKDWFKVRWRITAAGMQVWLDDQLQFEETRTNDLSGKNPVTIHSNSDPIEVKSVLVKRAAAK